MSLKDKIQEKWAGFNKQVRIGIVALVAGAVAVPALLNLGGSTSVENDPSLEAPMDHTAEPNPEASPETTPSATPPTEPPAQKLHAAPVKKTTPAAKTQGKKKITVTKEKKSGKHAVKGKSSTPKKPTAKLKKTSDKKQKIVAKLNKKKKKAVRGKSHKAGH